MKALALSALVAGIFSLASASRALALPTQGVFNVTSPDGLDLSDEADLGILLFDLDADTGKACRYYMEWSDNFDDYALSVDCYVDELKAHGASSCVANSARFVTTLLTNDRSLTCTGFNGSGVPTPVFLLLAGESAGSGLIDGVIQFTAAGTWLYSIHAAIYP